MDGENHSVFSDRRVVIALIVTLCIGFFVGWVMASPDAAVDHDDDEQEELLPEEDDEEEEEENSDEESAPESISEPSDPSGAHTDSFVVQDQPAGDSVAVSELSLTANRWIVIHENLDGEYGNILGARFFAPEHTEGVVNLLRATEPGQEYYAVLYRVADRAEDRNRRFDTDRDIPLVDDGGELVGTLFSTH